MSKEKDLTVIEVYLLCGIIGSGKSTWAKKKAIEDNIIIVNRDSIRKMIKGEYIFDLKYEAFIRSACYDIVTTAIDYGFNIIIDETNITKIKRKEWLDLIDIAAQDRGIEIKISLLHFIEIQKNVDNRMNDPRGLSREEWQSVYEDMIANFQNPSLDELPPNSEFIKISI